MTDKQGWGEDTDTGTESKPVGSQSDVEQILELDYVFDALGHSRRRYLCYTLLEDTEWTLTELAQKVAAMENDTPHEAVTDPQKERVYVSLYHIHVPKLVTEGVLRFDEVTETVTYAEAAEQVLSALEGVGATLDNLVETHAREGISDDE